MDNSYTQAVAGRKPMPADLALPIVRVDAFDYAAVAPTVAAQLEARATRIRQHMAHTTRSIIETGRELLAAKRALDHGQFGVWVQYEIGIAPRTAQAYMAAASFADADSKSATVALLPPSTVYRLAAKSTPKEVATAVIKRAEAGELLPDAVVAELISEARFQKREGERDQRERSRRQHKKAERLRRDEARRDWNEQRERDLALAATIAAKLVDRLGGVAASRHILGDADLFDVVQALRSALEGGE